MNSLQNHFLIAMPSLQDTFFERSVVYICEHDAKGAMGIIVNRPIGMKVDDLLEQIAELEAEEGKPATKVSSTDAEVLMGGPVTPERGFVLHTPQNCWSNSQEVTDNLMLTTSRDVLSAIGTNKSPEKYLIALGYAGWGKDQLENELAENTWLTIPASEHLLFDVQADDLWQEATRTLGFDIWQISSQTGHA